MKYDSHIVHLNDKGCQYSTNSKGHFCATVPITAPPTGEKEMTLSFQLRCKTSCVGGPRRRPFSLVFTLNIG